MKLRTKLLAGFGTLLAVTLVLVGAGWYQLTGIHQLNEELDRNYEASSLTNGIQRMVKDEAISLRNALIFSEEAAVRQELETIEHLSEEVTLRIQALLQTVDTIEQLQAVEELQSMNRQYNDYLAETTALIVAGNLQEAERIVLEQGQVMQTRFFEAIQAAGDEVENRMNESLETMGKQFENRLIVITILSLLGLVIGIAVAFRNVWRIAVRLKAMSRTMLHVASGKASLETRLDADSGDEIDDAARSFNQMAESLAEQMRKEQLLSEANQQEAWLKSHAADITMKLNSTPVIGEIAKIFLSHAMPLLDAGQAAFYYRDEQDATFYKLASYAGSDDQQPGRFSPGEGLVGQAAQEMKPIVLSEVPANYFRVQSGLLEALPVELLIMPVMNRGEVLAVVEIAALNRLSGAQQDLLDALLRNLGIILDNAGGRIRLARLLEESQAMTEELQVQSEELQTQQEELKSANEELEAQTQALRRSEEKLQQQQEELEQTNEELRDKAAMLEEQYMKLEQTNREVEEAKAELEEKARQLQLSSTYKSEFLANMSHELRTPLNSLLILSKLLADNPSGNLTEKQVEYAKTVYASGCDLLAMINDILDLAKVESGKMDIDLSHIHIDRLLEFIEQSFQPFAAEKRISFDVRKIGDIPETLYSDETKIQQILRNLLSNAFKFTNQGEVALEVGAARHAQLGPMLYFAVKDTGIGIAEDKQELIFEAFRQADGTTSRKYGGTGLGLSICRQLSAVLGGEITLTSQEGAGSTFTLWIGDYAAKKKQRLSSMVRKEAAAARMSEQAEPKIVSPPTAEDAAEPIMRMLIIDDDQTQRNSLMELIGELNVILTAVSSGAEALNELNRTAYDCLVLDLGLADMTGFELLHALRSNRLNENLHIFIYTGRELTSKEELELKRYASSIIIKDAQAPQRLMEELRVFLHAANESASRMPDETHRIHVDYEGLKGKHVLLADDDVRNVFALTNVLELHGMQVRFAENGIECLRVLDREEKPDIILMDIMMPEMDGYETMRKIRLNPEYGHIPIIALTAKAMKEDRALCIEAGASDYIVKPVQTEQLLSLIQVWLFPAEA